MEELILNHTYLVQYGTQKDNPTSVTVLRISEKAYHFRWNYKEASISWMLKEQFDNNYNIIEDITKLMEEIPEVQQPPINYTYYYTYTAANPLASPFVSSCEMELCSNCSGTGYIQDFNGQVTTGGLPVKICPVCMGAKFVTKKITTKQ